MLDMHIIADTFAIMSGCISLRQHDEEQRETHGILSFLHDPHDEADEWLAASTDDRARLRALANDKLAAVIKENARWFSSYSIDRKARYAEYQRRYRLRHIEAYKRRTRAYYLANIDRIQKHAREHRAFIRNNDPVRYQEYKDRELIRCRLMRAKEKSERPPVLPKKSKEERRLAKCAWNREHYKTHKPMRTEEEMQARRDYYRAKYHENKDKEKKK